jgi:hypothetical protein
LIVSADAELLTAPATPNPNNAAIAVVFNAFANMIVSCSCSQTLRWTRWLCFFSAATTRSFACLTMGRESATSV